MGLGARLCGLLLTLGATIAWADHDPFVRSFDAVPLKPTATLNGGLALDGARPWPRYSVRAALLFDFNLHVLAAWVGDEKIGDLIPHRLDAHAIFAWQLHDRLDLGVDLPLVLSQGDGFGLLEDQGFPQPGVYSLTRPCGAFFQRGCGLADLRATPRLLILDPEAFPVGLAAIAEVRIPIGDGLSFTGDRGWTVAPRIAAERAFGPVRVLGNVGYRLRNHGQFLNLYVGHEFTAGAGAVWRLPDQGPLKDLDVLGEVHLATPTTNPLTFGYSDSLKTPLELWVGARATVFGRWGVELTVGRGVGVTSGYGHPDLRVMLGVRYQFEFQDRDKDGVADDLDGCPDTAEDDDGFEDDDGCPDPDNDADGVLDAQDACPDDPGLKELEGCPDKDRDDVPDHVDECPDEAGPPQNDGCPISEPPLVVLERQRIRIKGNVLFETASAKIQKQSYSILDGVAEILRKHPEIARVLIEGHTDNRGSRAYNRDLSARRARAVLEYLVSQGIARDRLRAKGFGFDKPIASNETALGRAQNRRVEFTILDAEGKKAEEPPAPVKEN